MNLKIYILPGDVAYNAGDRYNLAAQLHLLRAAFPGAEIAVSTLAPDVDRQYFTAKMIRKGLILSFEEIAEIYRSDYVIWGGGCPIADHSSKLLLVHWFFSLLLIKIFLRKKIFAWSQGVVLQTGWGKFIARRIYKLPEYICVRDQGSYQALQELSLNKQVHLTADVAISGLPEEQDLVPCVPAEKLIGLSVTFWPFYNSSKAVLPYHLRRKYRTFHYHKPEELNLFIQSLIDLVNILLKKYPGRLVLLPRYADPLWDDLTHLETVRQKSDSPERIDLYTDSKLSPESFSRKISTLDLLLSIPLHDAIIATNTETPFVMLSYEQKGKDYMSNLGATNRHLDWSALRTEQGREEIVAMIERTLCLWPEMIVEQRKQRTVLRELAGRNTRLFQEMVDAEREK